MTKPPPPLHQGLKRPPPSEPITPPKPKRFRKISKEELSPVPPKKELPNPFLIQKPPHTQPESTAQKILNIIQRDMKEKYELEVPWFPTLPPFPEKITKKGRVVNLDQNKVIKLPRIRKYIRDLDTPLVVGMKAGVCLNYPKDSMVDIPKKKSTVKPVDKTVALYHKVVAQPSTYDQMLKELAEERKAMYGGSKPPLKRCFTPPPRPLPLPPIPEDKEEKLVNQVSSNSNTSYKTKSFPLNDASTENDIAYPNQSSPEDDELSHRYRPELSKVELRRKKRAMCKLKKRDSTPVAMTCLPKKSLGDSYFKMRASHTMGLDSSITDVKPGIKEVVNDPVEEKKPKMTSRELASQQNMETLNRILKDREIIRMAVNGNAKQAEAKFPNSTKVKSIVPPANAVKTEIKATNPIQKKILNIIKPAYQRLDSKENKFKPKSYKTKEDLQERMKETSERIKKYVPFRYQEKALGGVNRFYKKKIDDLPILNHLAPNAEPVKPKPLINSEAGPSRIPISAKPGFMYQRKVKEETSECIICSENIFTIMQKAIKDGQGGKEGSWALWVCELAGCGALFCMTCARDYVNQKKTTKCPSCTRTWDLEILEKQYKAFKKNSAD